MMLKWMIFHLMKQCPANIGVGNVGFLMFADILPTKSCNSSKQKQLRLSSDPFSR